MRIGPVVSIVIPTRNRSQAVSRLLRAIAQQRWDVASLEVIVVDDGSADDTLAALTAQVWEFQLRIVQQPWSGAAVARNAGARAASGDILLFLDDDVVPQPGVVAAHVSVHAEGPGFVAVGDLPPLVSDTTFLGVMLRSWWGEMQSAIRMPGHRYGYRDLLSGHFSIGRTQFAGLGGFDERLRCREDYELGQRTIAAGLQLRFVPQAVAYHQDDTDIPKTMRRKYDEGIADVQLVQHHPALAPSLPLSRAAAHSRTQRIMIRLAWGSPVAGRAVTRVMAAMLLPLERLKLRWRWRGFLAALLTYSYWRGVAVSLGDSRALAALLDRVPHPEDPATVDLTPGLEAAEERLDALRPRSVRLVYRETVIGEVPDVPGAEALRGLHLRPLIARSFREEYLRALAAAGAVPPPLMAAASALASAKAGKGNSAVTA